MFKMRKVSKKRRRRRKDELVSGCLVHKEQHIESKSNYDLNVSECGTV